MSIRNISRIDITLSSWSVVNKQPRPEDVVLLIPPRGGPWCAPRGGTLNPHPVAVSINLLEEVPLFFMFLFAFLVLNVLSDLLFI